MMSLIYIIPVIYLVIFPISEKVTFEFEYQTDATTLFKYISNADNFKTMNPTVLEFKVLNRDFNTVRVEYTEHLVQLPVITNYATAEYRIHDADDILKISSSHETCFYSSIFCVKTLATTSVQPLTEHTAHYQEEIEYGCPLLLHWFCLQEVHLQRALIMDNIKVAIGEIAAQ